MVACICIIPNISIDMIQNASSLGDAYSCFSTMYLSCLYILAAFHQQIESIKLYKHRMTSNHTHKHWYWYLPLYPGLDYSGEE